MIEPNSLAKYMLVSNLLLINNRRNNINSYNISTMKESKGCRCSKKDANKPKEVKTETMITPDDLGKIAPNVDGKVSEESVEESVIMINPDVESMDSRG